MIQKITYIESKQYNPYQNLALEEYLLRHVEEDECILYLWQNKHTIVIGRNQNAWKECLVSKLQEDDGYLVRRLSGGGAVFHDLGNLNFTFLVHKDHYDLEKQLEVILKAVQKLGIRAEKSGRNDILVDGRKFSGNAFFESEHHCYHHGTLMVHVNMQDLSKYLTVSKEKLQSKGVDSVKSRVTNLSEHAENLTIDILKVKLYEAFEEVYNKKANVIKPEELNQEEIKAGTEKFASWDFIFGKKIEFQYEVQTRFSWGNLEIQLAVNEGRIKEAVIYSDAMKPQLIQSLPSYLKGCKYEKTAICCELGLVFTRDNQEKEMMKDIITFLHQLEL